jgi:hypothetical protein
MEAAGSSKIQVSRYMASCIRGPQYLSIFTDMTTSRFINQYTAQAHHLPANKIFTVTNIQLNKFRTLPALPKIVACNLKKVVTGFNNV